MVEKFERGLKGRERRHGERERWSKTKRDSVSRREVEVASHLNEMRETGKGGREGGKLSLKM